MIGVGWVGLVHGRLLRRAGPRGLRARHRAGEGRVADARRGPDPRAGPARAARRATRERLHFTTDMARGARQRRAAVLLRRHAADLLGRRRPLARRGGGRRARRLDRPRDRDEEHGAGRHRPLDPAPPRRTSATSPTPSSSRRARRSRTSCTPTASWSAPARAPTGFADRVAALYEPLGGADRAHRRRQRRDDQARLERLPRHQDLVHQRDRQRLRGARRRRERGGARHGPRRRASARKFLQRRHRLRRLAASPRTSRALKQLAGNTGYHFQLLTAVIEVNELQKRRTIGKLQKHLGSLVGKEIALLGRGLQAGHRRRPRGHQPRARRPAAGRGRARARLRPGGRRERRARCSAAPRSATRRSRRSTAPTRAVLVTEWPEFAELDWAGEVQERMAHAAGGRRPQLPRPRGAARGRLHLRGRRRASADAGAVLAGGEGTRLRPLTLTTPEAGDAARRAAVPDLHARLAARATAWTRRSSPAASSPTASRGARRRLRRHAPALRDRGGAARHRRAGAPGARRGPARRAPARAQRRRAHRHRPDRRARAARAHRRARDARAGRGRRHRPATAWCPPTTTAGSRRSSRSPTARRPRTGSTRAPTCSSATVVESDPRRPRRLVRARGLPRRWSATASTAATPRATGSTSGRPSATSRRPTTCSPAARESTLPPRDETGSLIYEGCLTAGAHIGRRPCSGALLGGHRLDGGALGAPRPRDRRRRLPRPRERARRAACGSATARGSEPGAIVGAGARSRPARGRRRARIEPAETRRMTATSRSRLRALSTPVRRCSATCSPSRTRSATRCGASRRPASPRARRAGRPGRLRHGRLGDRRRPRRGRDRRPRHARRCTRARLRAAGLASAPTRSCSARATPATPRRRSPASRPPARPVRRGSRSPPAASSPSAPARRACR